MFVIGQYKFQFKQIIIPNTVVFSIWKNYDNYGLIRYYATAPERISMLINSMKSERLYAGVPVSCVDSITNNQLFRLSYQNKTLTISGIDVTLSVLSLSTFVEQFEAHYTNFLLTL